MAGLESVFQDVAGTTENFEALESWHDWDTGENLQRGALG